MPVARLGAALSTGLGALTVLLAVLAAAVGVSGAGLAVGLACGVAVTGAVASVRPRPDVLGPADLVTLTRAHLGCAVAALVAEATMGREPALQPLVALTAVALALDAVDGTIARHTRTTSAFGARFDGEADAFLLLVLSVYVAGVLGWWVLAIGAVRYVFGAAGIVLPWMRARLPFRYWRKVVTAVQGVVLVVAAADLVARPVVHVAVGVAIALLAESFGRDVVWLWRRRDRAAASGGARTTATAPAP